MPPARISLTLSRHFSLLFIASGRSSGLHPVSSQSCCMYVRAGRPAFDRSYVGVHGSTSLMSSSLLFQQCPACLVRLTYFLYKAKLFWYRLKYLLGHMSGSIGVHRGHMSGYIGVHQGHMPGYIGVHRLKYLLGRMSGSIGVHHLWVRPCFSSSVLHIWFV